MARRNSTYALLIVALASCQPTSGTTAHGADPSAVDGTVTTADGEIIGVDRAPPQHELARGLRIQLRPQGEEPIAVQLAPGWYLDEQGIGYGQRERLEVRGVQRIESGQSVVIAREVRQDQRWVPLRDAQGRPVWQSPPDAGP